MAWSVSPRLYHRLIADHYNRTAEPIQRADALRGAGQQLHAFHRGQVMALDVDGSIAIEKDDQV